MPKVAGSTPASHILKTKENTMAIELHHLNTHGMMEQACDVLDGVVRLKERIAELERMDTEHTLQIAKMNGYINHLEEELEASKRKEKESRELADPYTLYCEASAESLRKALGEYRWRRPCDDRPPEWSCVIVYFHNEEGDEQYRLAVYSKENGWEVDDDELYKTAEIEAWHPLPSAPKEEK